MTTKSSSSSNSLITRRDVLHGAISSITVASLLPKAQADTDPRPACIRSVNIMNFIRGDEPRVPTDLMEPVRNLMSLIKTHKFPATWLLQYDALTSGPFVEFLKAEMPENHEVGIWFELNRRIC